MYKRNDILVNKDGVKRKVLAVVDSLCALSYLNEYERYFGWYLQEELGKVGYTLDSSEWVLEDGDKYCYVDINLRKTYQGFWHNSKAGNERKELNLIFPTRELAEKRLAEIVTFLKK